ncbi:hypothetical protein MIR68_002277 [Amoeboaphelidium protococcarum]|nr:hypothetical protein MIR68_002277 [Amoeboaphelidium protococcarum]
MQSEVFGLLPGYRAVQPFRTNVLLKETSLQSVSLANDGNGNAGQLEQSKQMYFFGQLPLYRVQIAGWIVSAKVSRNEQWIEFEVDDASGLLKCSVHCDNVDPSAFRQKYTIGSVVSVIGALGQCASFENSEYPQLRVYQLQRIDQVDEALHYARCERHIQQINALCSERKRLPDYMIKLIQTHSTLQDIEDDDSIIEQDQLSIDLLTFVIRQELDRIYKQYHQVNNGECEIKIAELLNLQRMKPISRCWNNKLGRDQFKTALNNALKQLVNDGLVFKEDEQYFMIGKFEVAADIISLFAWKSKSKIRKALSDKMSIMTQQSQFLSQVEQIEQDLEGGASYYDNGLNLEDIRKWIGDLTRYEKLPYKTFMDAMSYLVDEGVIFEESNQRYSVVQ